MIELDEFLTGIVEDLDTCPNNNDDDMATCGASIRYDYLEWLKRYDSPPMYAIFKLITEQVEPNIPLANGEMPGVNDPEFENLRKRILHLSRQFIEDYFDDDTTNDLYSITHARVLEADQAGHRVSRRQKIFTKDVYLSQKQEERQRWWLDYRQLHEKDDDMNLLVVPENFLCVNYRGEGPRDADLQTFPCEWFPNYDDYFSFEEECSREGVRFTERGLPCPETSDFSKIRFHPCMGGGSYRLDAYIEFPYPSCADISSIGMTLSRILYPWYMDPKDPNWEEIWLVPKEYFIKKYNEWKSEPFSSDSKGRQRTSPPPNGIIINPNMLIDIYEEIDQWRAIQRYEVSIIMNEE